MAMNGILTALVISSIFSSFTPPTDDTFVRKESRWFTDSELLADRLDQDVKSIETWIRKLTTMDLVCVSGKAAVATTKCKQTIWRRPVKRCTYLGVILLLLAGNTHPNPGPTTDPCGVCAKGVRINQRGVYCDRCDVCYHCKCIGMSKATYDHLSSVTDQWFCNKSDMPLPAGTTTPESQDNDDHHINTGPGVPEADQSSVSDTPLQGLFDDVKKEKGLKMIHLNICGLKDKIDELRISLEDTPLDILTMSETHLDDTVTDEKISIPGYSKPYRKDRSSGNSWGGVITYVSASLNSHRREDLELSEVECVWTQVMLPKTRPILIASAYCTPPVRDEHLQGLEDTLALAHETTCEMLILGDMNLDLLPTKKKGLVKKLLVLHKVLQLHQLVEEPTRVTQHSQTLIDHIATNRKENIVKTGVITTGLSDHRAVYAIRKATQPRKAPRVVTARSYKRLDTEQFCSDMANQPWHRVTEQTDVDLAWTTWRDIFRGVCDVHAPYKTTTVRGEKTPWATDEFIALTQERDHVKKRAEKTKDAALWSEYKTFRNCVNNLRETLKKNYYQTVINDNKNNPKGLWSILKNITGTNKSKEQTILGVTKMVFYTQTLY